MVDPTRRISPGTKVKIKEYHKMPNEPLSVACRKFLEKWAGKTATVMLHDNEKVYIREEGSLMILLGRRNRKGIHRNKNTRWRIWYMISSGILNKAIKEAKKSNLPIFRIGAVVFKGNRVISFGHNKKGICTKIHPRYRNIYDTVHAEQNAIIKVKNWDKLKDTSILVIRLCRSNVLSMAYPCEMCLDLIRHVGIKEIYYTNHNSEIIREVIW